MWKQIIAIGLGFLLGSLFVTNGILLLFRPDSFLRFNDWLNRGDYVFRTASWRRDVHNPEWKALGAACLVMGVWVLIICLRLLIKRLA